jgi:hypothetical protein
LCGASAEQVKRAFFHPGLTLRILFLIEAVARIPQVFIGMNEVQDEGRAIASNLALCKGFFRDTGHPKRIGDVYF